nr:unnamed protein product [Callosobruchus chinensis]
MSVASSDELLQLIRPHVTYKDTKFRKAITTAEKLAVSYVVVYPVLYKLMITTLFLLMLTL